MSNNFEISTNQVRKVKRISFFLFPLIFLFILIMIFNPFTTIPAGHVGVVSLFGKIENEAKAQAEAIEIKGAALRKNPEILKLRAIERWDGVVPRVNLGGNAIPLINLNDLSKKLK